jgi:hypothetical protein
MNDKHVEHAQATGNFQCTWYGAISCRKCYFLTEAETKKFYRDGEKLMKQQKGKRPRVPILEIPMKVKIVMGKPKRV